MKTDREILDMVVDELQRVRLRVDALENTAVQYAEVRVKEPEEHATFCASKAGNRCDCYGPKQFMTTDPYRICACGWTGIGPHIPRTNCGELPFVGLSNVERERTGCDHDKHGKDNCRYCNLPAATARIEELERTLERKEAYWAKSIAAEHARVEELEKQLEGQSREADRLLSQRTEQAQRASKAEAALVESWNEALEQCAAKALRWAQGRNENEHNRWIEFASQVRALRKEKV